ncbi:TetR/AcrR family transcriptional regulator [Actinomadura rugatobispora]|uniref:TetR/AcrR family transcriptional regulator n=1 Tax=Actinomadura rugatobispora TaxID=1994 RepID=A0ABW0ZY21_9ACTN|nr:TetR/AcrR family transcriptional regulator [Actinomadura rugatobispora]
MPKVVDPAARREEVAAAVWRVVRRDGLDRASVRNVAAEAGLSMGSLRHYFGTQSELLNFTLHLIIERIEARIARIGPEAGPRERAERILGEVLPLDEERAAENQVWLAFNARALVDPELRALCEKAHDVLHAGCRELARALAPGSDVELETDRLHALVDGLAVHAAMRPERATPTRMRAALTRHLDALGDTR